MRDLFSGLRRPASDYLGLSSKIPERAYSARSNLVRYGLLHKRGGVYLDFDVLVVRDLRGLLVHDAFLGEETVWKSDEDRVAGRWSAAMIPGALAYALAYGARRADARWLGGRGVLEPLARAVDPLWSTRSCNNAVIGATPRSAFIERVLDAALARDPRIRYDLGPTLVSHVARAADPASPDVHVLPPDAFYVQPPSYSFRFFEGPPRRLGDEAYLIHYVSSNHGARLAALDRNEVLRRRDEALFYRLAADVTERARLLPRGGTTWTSHSSAA